MCSAAALQILKSTFGFDGFLPGQIEAISAVMDGEDVVVRLPTNGGKADYQKVYQAHRSSNEDEVSEAMDGRDSRVAGQ